MFPLIYLLFFLSGLSGLIYQVVWVRMFGNVFGNTIYSASIVVAVFMLGLGAGSYIVGAWADRRYAARPESLLRAYGNVELAIAVLGFAIAAVLPHLGALSALVSSYSREPSGWHVLSTMSYVARAGIAIGLLTPITLLMGGTLTLLIRHLVRSDLEIGGWRIAMLYGINTAGAALGAFLTDFTLVSAWGLWSTQMVAVFFNVVAGAGALYLASRLKPAPTPAHKVRRGRLQPAQVQTDVTPSIPDHGGRVVALTSLALAMTGMAAMGMEILWFRHFTILLGGFRAVFSLLLTVILIGIGVGSLAGGVLHRRTGRPIEWFMAVQAVFVASTLIGVGAADVRAIDAAADTAGNAGGLPELWFNVKPMLMEVALPALLMGFSFPLANAIVQRAEQSVGRRAGILYLANTAGAVGGSLAAGFVLLPVFGLQTSAATLMGIAAVAIVPLYLATDGGERVPEPAKAGPYPQETKAGPYLQEAKAGPHPMDVGAGFSRPVVPFAASLLVAGGALTTWLLLPSDYVRARTVVPKQGERLLAVSDGLTEIIAVTETPGKGRTLMTNGHAMSSTQPLSQRYMRSLAHIPLLSIERPESVLVIGFGVGNTTHAATLHPTVRRVELADLSRDILAHAAYFADGNKNVLTDPKVVVHVNDGRQHLQMQAPSSYDLIALEPPPIAYAGVGALYSREFYDLARTRLKPNGYVSQWLPAYQVPSETALAMVRAFVEVFPQAVLLSGAESDLLLLGTNGPRIEIDPNRVAAVLSSTPPVRADLERVSLGTVREIVGTFVGSARTLADATRGVLAVMDDRPLQEYGVRSMLNFGYGVPASIVDLDQVAGWCPRCFQEGRPIAAVEGLDVYLGLLDLAYSASSEQMVRARRIAETQGRVVAGSTYLGAVVPESAEMHNVLGLALAERGQLDGAIVEFRQALELEADNAASHWHLGAALASRGAHAEATAHLSRSVELDPENSQAHSDLGLMLAIQGKYDEAVDHLERALALDPQSVDARRNLQLLQQQRPRVAAQP